MEGLSGFPSETLQEALDSVRFLQKNRDHWTFGGLGEFVLTQGAIAARQPEKFGIRNLRPYDGEDVAWQVYYEDTTGGHGGGDAASILNKEKATLSKRHYERPWVGGVDSAHTIFYQDKYEYQLLDVVMDVPDLEATMQHELFLNGRIVVDNERYSYNNLFKDNDLSKLLRESFLQAKSLVAEEFDRMMVNMQFEPDATPAGKRYFVRNDGVAFPFPDEMIDFLHQFEGGNQFNKIVLTADKQDLYQKLLDHSVKHRFLCLRSRQVKERAVTFA